VRKATRPFASFSPTPSLEIRKRIEFKTTAKMKKLRDEFSEEEKSQLRYLGSMLPRPNTPEEQETKEILDALEKAARTNAGGINQTPRKQVED
jgi:predicted Zn-dependent protease